MIKVTSAGGDRLRISVRGHDVYADQPVADGGDDTAPTPTELFAGALAACVAYYAERYLRRHGLDAAGLAVTCDYTWGESPHRVAAFDVAVDVPGLPAERREALTRVVQHCTVHNTLRVPPRVKIAVTTATPAAA